MSARSPATNGRLSHTSNKVVSHRPAAKANDGDNAIDIEVVEDEFKGKKFLAFVDRNRAVDRFPLQMGRMKANRLLCYIDKYGLEELHALLTDFVVRSGMKE